VDLHPGELDTGQPRMPVGRLTQFRHSVNTRGAETKLRRLVRDFRFGPVRDVLAGSGLLLTRGAA
jgi:hypothetical protein